MSMSLAWGQPNKIDRFFFGSGGTAAKPLPNAFQTVTGTIGMEFSDLTAYNYFLSGGLVSVVWDFVGNTIASTYKDEVKFTLSAVQFRGDSPNVAGPDVLTLSAPIAAFDDGTNPPLQIDYVSTDTTV
jgi:hypothetical protein